MIQTQPHRGSLLNSTSNFQQLLSMKKLSPLLFGVLLLAYACSPEAPEGDQVEAGEAQAVNTDVAGADTLMVDLASSKIGWVATEPGGGGHNGFIYLESGHLLVADGDLKGGSFVIDMNSIDVQDLQGDRKGRLEGHLKNEDFFQVSTYPTASFTITGVEPAVDDTMATHMITGNLTMKDSVKSIQIPATIEMGTGTISAMTPPFTIDRTQWGVVHRSSAVGTLAEKLIHDEVGMKIELKAGS